MKHGSITKLQSQIGSQLSGHQRVETVQSDQKRQCQLVRFWLPYFGMRTIFYSSITLRKQKLSIVNIIWRYWCVWRKKLRENDPKWRNKCSYTETMHRVTIRLQQWQNCTNWRYSRIGSTPTVFSGFVSQRKLPVFRPKKNALGREIWLQ